MQIIRNLVGLVIELALIAGAAWAVVFHTWWMAGVTAVMILVLGGVLEWVRQQHEYPFYFGKGRSVGRILAGLAGLIEGCVKAVAGAAAIILTFAGDPEGRGVVLAIIFAGCLLAGTAVLRRGFYQYDMRPMRWGYFRLAVPLGVLFSLSVQGAVGLGLIKVQSLQSLAGTLIFDLPQKPSVSQLSDLAFNVRQTLDALVVDVASRLLGEGYAPIVSVLLSVNVLIGFALAIYVVAILEFVLIAEGGRDRSQRSKTQAGE